jgi:hypothetical protein
METIVNHIIEIHSLNLKPGKRGEFHRLYIEEALPLLKRWSFEGSGAPSFTGWAIPPINRILSPSSSIFQRFL